MHSTKNDFNFTHYKLGDEFNDCKFELAISEIKKLSNVQTPFEKINILIKTNEYIEKEIQECFDRNFSKKKTFSPDGDKLIPIWTYVIVNADISNILTECAILQDFKLKDSGYSQSIGDYHLTSVLAVMEEFRKGEASINKYANITPYYVSSNNYVPQEDYSNNMHSKSFIQKPGVVEDDGKSFNTTVGGGGGLLGTFKNIFKA